MPDSTADSRTLVLIHAFPLGARMWAPQLAAFGGWRIVTPALPGFDGSAAGVSSMEAFATHINGELDRLGIERAVIGGLSLGGYVTFGVIRQRPERASALILADTRCGADSDEGRAARLRMLTLLAQKGPLGVFDEMRPKLFGKTTHAERPGVVEEGKWMVEAQSPAGVEGAIRAMLGRPDSTPLLASIHVPTLIMVGEEDELTPPAESVRMHEGIAGSTLIRIPRAGHVSNLEDPAAFNAAVSAFLATRVTTTI
jgi:3-oxoadipate enol-lactonase